MIACKSRSLLPNGPDRLHLLPARLVLERYCISNRTLDRWLCRQNMDFPKPVIIAKRRYWYDDQLTLWEFNQAAFR